MNRPLLGATLPLFALLAGLAGCESMMGGGTSTDAAMTTEADPNTPDPGATPADPPAGDNDSP